MKSSCTPGHRAQVDELDMTEVESRTWMTVLHNCDCHLRGSGETAHGIACSEGGLGLAWQVHNTGKAVVKVGAEPGACAWAYLASIGLIVTVTQS
jgi:hypothetical protein